MPTGSWFCISEVLEIKRSGPFLREENLGFFPKVLWKDIKIIFASLCGWKLSFSLVKRDFALREVVIELYANSTRYSFSDYYWVILLWVNRVKELKNQSFEDYKWLIYRRQCWFGCDEPWQQKQKSRKHNHTHKCPVTGNYTVHPHYSTYYIYERPTTHTLHTRDKMCAGPMARSSRSDSEAMSADRRDD